MSQSIETEMNDTNSGKESSNDGEPSEMEPSIAAPKKEDNGSHGGSEGNCMDLDISSCSEEFTGDIGLDCLDANVLSQILEHVDQFDLVNLAVTCSRISELAKERLYKRVTVVLNAEFATRYERNEGKYISENGIKYMNSSMIFCLDKLLKFYNSVKNNNSLICQIKFFVFDKCFQTPDVDIYAIQTELMDFFGKYSQDLSFLHITFVNLKDSITNLRRFLQNENVRSKIFKLFAKSFDDLTTPVSPPCLTNLFLMVNESDLTEIDEIDQANYPFQLFNSLFTLTCSTDNSLGLELVRRLRLVNDTMKLKLKAFTLYHNHRDKVEDETMEMGHLSNFLSTLNDSSSLDSAQRIESQAGINPTKMDRKLNFQTLENKIDLTSLSHLSLRVDCDEHRDNSCNCFGKFFEELTTYSKQNGGLPKLKSFEFELFPNYEWFRPHQMLERVLTPLGNFTMTLKSLSKLTIDFSTPGFKMFSNMSSSLLNKLNERLVEAFFLGFYSPVFSNSSNIKILQLPDFLTSFIYYRPEFYESILHTCKCWGCHLLLEKLKDEFLPIRDGELSEDDEDMDDESSYFVLMGYLLGKLQTDREICTPINRSSKYRNYPLCKGEPHILHKYFHKSRRSCSCDVAGDPHGQSDMNIDNLVTTYIVHQLKPFVSFLSVVFPFLQYLMIHGITYELDTNLSRLMPVYDAYEYPPSVFTSRSHASNDEDTPPLSFGSFKDLT